MGRMQHAVALPGKFRLCDKVTLAGSRLFECDCEPRDSSAELTIVLRNQERSGGQRATSICTTKTRGQTRKGRERSAA